MPTTARRSLRHPTGGPWGAGLFLIGLAEFALGINYVSATPADLRAALSWINTVIPISGWALLWLSAGLYSMVRALCPPQRHVDMLPAIAVITLWSGMYGAYWLLIDADSREWTTSVAWGALAAVLMSFGRCVNPPTGSLDR